MCKHERRRAPLEQVIVTQESVQAGHLELVNW
jgi:hypothetical protein